jgi:hypothetical protein
MKKPFRLEKLPTDCGQRKALYRTLGPFYKKRYGMKEGPVALEHAKSVTEEVARYTKKSMDKHWAGMCVALAALHILDMKADPPDSVLRHLSKGDRDLLERSLISINILRAEDEAPVGAKDSRIYKTLLQPYHSHSSGLVVLPPEAFVRVIDMSEPQFFAGKNAKDLHRMMSRGKFPDMVHNMAHSVLRYYRPAAIQLLLFSCYDKQSNIAARYLYPELFRKMDELFKSLKDDFKEVKKRFSENISKILKCAKSKRFPVIEKTDRETGKKVPYIMREKTPGSATLKALKKELVAPDGTNFNPEKILDGITDPVASMLVSMRHCDAEGLYCMINSKDRDLIVEAESVFYKGCRDPKKKSHPEYQGVGHLTYDAKKFGAKRMQKIELQVRSLKGDHDYHHGKAGRGFRDSPELADAWGDYDNFKIVQALGHQE